MMPHTFLFASLKGSEIYTVGRQKELRKKKNHVVVIFGKTVTFN